MFHRSLLKDKRGVTAIEFGFVALPFFMLIIGIMELGMYYTAATVIEGGTVRAARIIRTGQAQESADPLDTFLTELCNNVDQIMDCSDIQYEVINPDGNNFSDAGDANPSFDGDGNLDSAGFDPGGANEVVIIRVAYRFPFATPWLGNLLGGADSSVLIMSTATVRNEPYEF